MRKLRLGPVVVVTLLFVAAAVLFLDSLGASRTIEEIAAEEAKLVDGKCSHPELIDRWLLQQSWFHDERFTKLAGAFGQSSFGLYQEGGMGQEPLEGAFCIDGNNLVVRYFKRRYVPVGLRPGALTIEFGTKLHAMGEDTYVVQELTEERLVLTFASDGLDHVFYRKN